MSDLGPRRQHSPDWTLVAALTVFTMAYCVQPLLIDGLKYQGAAAPSAFLYLMPHYLAMVCVGLIPTSDYKRRSIFSYKFWKKAIYVSTIDILHQLSEKAGLVFAGSAVYIIVGSSSIVWTAVVSAIVLGKRFMPLQWVSLLLICLGLTIQSSALEFKLQNEEFIGVLLTLGSAILHGLTFVTNEKFLTDADAISGPKLVFMMGAVNSAILLVWTCLWTLPQWNTLVTARVILYGGNRVSIGMLMFGLFCCGFVHSATLWYILKTIGAVSSGVLKGLKTASVFILSHYFYCRIQESQCLTPIKAISASICVLGVMMYSIVTSRLDSGEKAAAEEQAKRSLVKTLSHNMLTPASSSQQHQNAAIYRRHVGTGHSQHYLYASQYPDSTTIDLKGGPSHH